MALKIVKNLIKDLNNNNISYCHWKSIEHLEASFNGDTDLDILFDIEQEKQVKEILENNGFHLFDAIWYKKYSGIIDYIGYDKDEGKTVHVHTHFNLDFGEVGIKSYYLPWSEYVLLNRIYSEEFGIYIVAPQIEYLLLIVRTALKRDIINFRSNRRIIIDFNREAEWLYPQVSIDDLLPLIELLLTSEIGALILKIREKEGYDKASFLRLKKMLKVFFKKNRVISGRKVTYLKYIHFSNSVKKRFNKVPGINFKFRRRALHGKGIIVSLMGPDGAGKSTQTELITKEFKKKVDVTFMYMGSGKGEKSLQRKLIDSIFDMMLRLRSTKNNSLNTNNVKNELNGNPPISKKNILIQFFLSIKATSLAFERKIKLKNIKREYDRGSIIICDRYPQTEYPGFNDGLKLVENLNSSNIILKSLAKYEKKCYDLSKIIYPQMVVKFSGNIKTLHSRRPEMQIEELEGKQNGIEKLNFTDKTHIINVNIEEDIMTIKSKIINEISKLISNSNRI